MITKLLQKPLLFLMALMMVVPLAMTISAPQANAGDLMLWDDPFSKDDVGKDAFEQIGLGTKDPREVAATVVQVLLGFLGVIAVIIILIGGFKWMTAGGNEDKVGEAKKLLGAGVVGLLIVLAAFGLSLFIVRALAGATGAQGQFTY